MLWCPCPLKGEAYRADACYVVVLLHIAQDIHVTTQSDYTSLPNTSNNLETATVNIHTASLNQLEPV